MITTTYSPLRPEAESYWKWFQECPIPPIPAPVAREGAGSEARTPLMHFGTVMPVYLAAIRYLSELRPGPGMKLIELGCGTGRALSYLASRFPPLAVYGVDYSPNAIAYAQQHYGHFGVTFRHADTTKDTFYANEMFDVVISSHVIEHIKKEQGELFLRECRRLLKPGGFLFVGTPDRRSGQELYMPNDDDRPERRLTPPHEHEYTLRELKECARAVFNDVKMDQLNNPVFRKVFQDGVSRLKPSGGLLNRLRNWVYTTLRDDFPKPVFDAVVKFGMNSQLRSRGLTYYDVLVQNAIEPETPGCVPDNLLLVCQK